MRAVSRFEAHLLRVLHALFHRAPLEQVLPGLLKPPSRPRCLSRDAVELVQDTLAKGCVQFLARRGWMRERFLRNGSIATGRLWERTPPTELGLAFSPHTLEFLLQLASGTLGKIVPKATELTIGDRLLLVLSFDLLRAHEPGEAMSQTWLPLHQDGLCRLAFLEELAEGSRRFRIDWLPWMTGIGASILESLQGWLADRWTQLERKKETLGTPARLRKIGVTQQRVHGEFLDALESVQRRDLARCFLLAGQRLLQDRPTSRKWIRNLDLRKERIADRLGIYHDVFAFLRQLERLATWQQQALGVGYFDEGYAASQLWKADWERHGGDAFMETARAILREVEPLK